MLKNKLAGFITSKPDIIQFAKDRKYEEAWIISQNQPQPSSQEIRSYLTQNQFSLLIVEYIWNSTDDANRFVLTVFLDKKCQLQNHEQFINLCFDEFYHYSKLEHLIDLFDSKIIGHPYLFQNPVEEINLGIFNHWLSVCPVELWRSGQPLNYSNIKTKIHSRPEVIKSKLNYQGLLFRFNVSGNYNGPVYGLKTPCCHKRKDSWEIDPALIKYWVEAILDKKIV